MKIFHTADWHLGKLVHGVSMTDDQRYVLQQFVEAVKIEKPDVVIIAGDLFDRAVAPVEAVRLLNDILSEVVLTTKTPVLAIAGNHDSPGRIDFASDLLRASGLHMIGHFKKEYAPIVLNDEYGEVHFHLIPFAEPSQVKHVFENDTIETHQDAMKTVTEFLAQQLDPTVRQVFIGHAFVTKYGLQEENTSTSERPLSIGGSECVDAALFDKFHYTALGHLHQAHYVLNERIQYAGSPLKYSMSEHNHQKGYLVVQLDAQGGVTVEKKLLTPIRDLRIVEGKMAELMTHSINDDYVFIRLTDDQPVLSAMEHLRTVYPNTMHIARVIQHTENNEPLGIDKRETMDDSTLFQAFYQEITGQLPSETTQGLFNQVLQDLLDDGREITKG